jgi:hypothetical protein
MLPAIPAEKGLILLSSLIAPNSKVYQYIAPILAISSLEAPRVASPIS